MALVLASREVIEDFEGVPELHLGGLCAGRRAGVCRWRILSPGAPRADPFRVLLDGEASGSSQRVDVDGDRETLSVSGH